MTRLAPDLFDRRYDDLLEIGRARLPALAPEWTDYNAHDPGITLMELLAWVTEAQLYSLGRTRRDERIAYAALLGVEPTSRQPARGLLWSDRADPASPATTFVGTRVIEPDAPVRLENHEEPVFRPERRVLWVPGRIVRLWSQLADRSTRDLTRSNDRGTVFLPFGEEGGPRDVLNLEFETRGEEGLFPARRAEADGACWIIGVRAADGEALQDEEPASSYAANVSISLVAGDEQFTLPVVDDSTAGLLRTGVLTLDVSGVTGSPRTFRIEMWAPRGFARPPRWLRIEPTVLPITQRTRIEREPHRATGEPDFTLDLDVPGLSFDRRLEPVRVEVRTDAEFEEWKRCDRLSEQGPDDRTYELDTARGKLLFGNGVNGKRPGFDAEIYVSYSVCDGEAGNVARSRRWTVGGFAGVFGINPDPVAGGIGGSDATTLQRTTRRRAREDHALVSAADIESAALALPLLELARAWIVASRGKGPQTGTVTLIALRARPDGKEPAQPPETPRWLEAVRRRLAGRIPLGTRFVVAAPRYVDFGVRAEVEVEAGRDPATIEEAVKARLRERLALVKSRSTPEPRQPGVPVSRSDVAAWILGVGGVERVTRVELVEARRVTDAIEVPRRGLPRLLESSTEISATRPAAGRRA